ncbi:MULTISPECIES: hypothetical protein [unclassified Pseudovibrio]|uniref:hypothetical protein n=1 Tax=unclassified Pseudovibrio TaxID=2627060 RepID=UPI000711220E|nr:MULTISPECIES: hypothetical protein [unclassified Pseudovibrio]
MRLSISLAIFWGVWSSAAFGQGWLETSDESELWTKKEQVFNVPGLGKPVKYSALRFERLKYYYEVAELHDLLIEKYPDLSRDSIAFDKQQGTERVIEPTLREAWEILKNDERIVALIPFGFSETAGGDEIAGFRKNNGEVRQELFAAPNLDAIFCFDDEGRRQRLNTSYDGQIPLLLEIIYKTNADYTYVDGLDLVRFDGGNNKGIYREDFEKCRDMVQLGYTILSPRDAVIDKDSQGRIKHGRTSREDERLFRRIVMMYDRFGYLNFIQVNEPAHKYDVGVALSSHSYFDGVPCRYRENPNYLSRSLSCELWAVSVSAYDDAPIAFRAEPLQEVDFWGDPDRTTPGVMIVRHRTN